MACILLIGFAQRGAAQTTSEALEQGDVDGYAIWLRIGTAIETLTRGRREDESLN
jgi:hypothetical protein